MSKNYDVLWKGVIEDVFEDFLVFLYPEARTVFDFEKGFVFLDKELEQVFFADDRPHSSRIVDKLVKVFTRSGDEEWILIHIEIQGQYQKDFGRRMFTYYYRILDKHDKPVTAVAVFTEGSNVVRPNKYETEFLGTRLSYTFNTYMIAQQSIEDLLANDNPFALVVLTAKIAFEGKQPDTKEKRDGVLLNLKLRLLREMHSRKIPGLKMRVLMNFLRFYVRFETEQVNIDFEKEVETITNKSKITMGIEELLLKIAKEEGIEEGMEIGIERGIEEGIEKGRQKEAIEIACEMKKDGILNAQIAKFTKLKLDEIEKI